MKKRIVALLVMLAVLCSATVAMAAVVPAPAPAENASEMTVPSVVETPDDLAYIKSVTALEDGKYAVTFTANPFENDYVEWDENGKRLPGASTYVSVRFHYVEDSDNWHSSYGIYEEDLEQTADGYIATIEPRVYSGTTITFDQSNIWRYTYTEDGRYNADYYYNADNSFESGYASIQNGDQETDPENYSYFSYDYSNGSLDSYYSRTADEGINLSFNRVTGELKSYSVSYYNKDEAGDGAGTLYVSYTPYGVMSYASYEQNAKSYYWDTYEHAWYSNYWDEETGDYIYEKVGEIAGVANPEELAAPITGPIPSVSIVKDASGVAALPFSMNDVAKITSYTVDDGVLTVNLDKDIRAFGKAYEDSRYDSAYAYVEVGYTLDGENYYPNAVIGEDGLTATLDLPEGAEIQDVHVYGDASVGGYNYWYSNYEDGRSYVSYTVKGVDYSYNFDENGALTSTNVQVPGDRNYSFQYEASGALTSYSYRTDEGVYITFDAKNKPITAYYWDEENSKSYNWDSEIGWYEFGEWNEETGAWEMIPVAGPEGIENPAKIKSVFGAYRTWYPDNTVGVLGLSLRDDLGLSDKWYNIVPVDLTVDSTQTVGLVASNMYYFGSATIAVADGEVTVTYKLPSGHAYLKSECLQWFTSLDQITDDFLANPAGEYAFGEPVSISEKLNGQNVALLFICNRVTYGQPITNGGAMLTRYYRNLDQWQDWRAQLTSVLDSMVVVEPEEAAENDVVATATDVTESDMVATETDTNAEAEEPEEAAAIEEPAEAEEAVSDEESVATEEPAATEESVATEEPVADEEPAAIEEPAEAEEPVADEEPAATEESVESTEAAE